MGGKAVKTLIRKTPDTAAAPSAAVYIISAPVLNRQPRLKRETISASKEAYKWKTFEKDKNIQAKQQNAGNLPTSGVTDRSAVWL